MGNLIVSMACGEQSRRYAEITFPLIQKYAQKCGADFYAKFQENPRYNNVGFQKWTYTQFFPQYERILHIDADMLVKPSTPNLFSIAPLGSFAAVNEYRFQSPGKESPFVDRFKDIEEFAVKNGKNPVVPNFYANVGLYLFDDNHSSLFSREEQPLVHFREQTQINYYLNKYPSLYPFYELNPSLNFMSLMEDHGLSRKDAYIVHYAGNWRGLTTDDVIKMMKEDLVNSNV